MEKKGLELERKIKLKETKAQVAKKAGHLKLVEIEMKRILTGKENKTKTKQNKLKLT